MIYKLIKSLFFGNVGYCRGPQDLSLIIDIVAGSGRQTRKGKKQQRQEKNQNIRIEQLEKKKGV